MTAAATPAPARQSAHKPADQAAAKRELSDVRSKVRALTAQQAQTAQRRESISAELSRRARALAAAAGDVRETDQAMAAKQRELEQLEQQRQALTDKLHDQRQAIAELLRATYALGHGSDLRLLLGDEDVARIGRALAYSHYFQADRLRKVRALMGDLVQLQTLQANIAIQQQALEEVRSRHAAQVRSLAAERAAQQKLADEINATYKSEAARLGALKQNEQSLNQLVAQLQKAIEQAERAAADKTRSKGATGASGNAPARSLADIRGNLPWPASGAVNSYGNGVLIKAAGGSDVRAVARGKVVFANFLRGYGMLIILDHGNGWMSMYGNNEQLLRTVGQVVNAGEAVGTAMAPTGSNTGAYFELRDDGKPVDPRAWLGRHR